MALQIRPMQIRFSTVAFARRLAGDRLWGRMVHARALTRRLLRLDDGGRGYG